MVAYFPDEFRDFEEVEYNLELLKKIKLELRQILYKEDNSKAIDRHEKNILKMDLPNIWNIYQRENKEVEMETEFEKFMLAVSEHTNENIDNISVFRFYSLLSYIKSKNKANKNGNN